MNPMARLRTRARCAPGRARRPARRPARSCLRWASRAGRGSRAAWSCRSPRVRRSPRTRPPGSRARSVRARGSPPPRCGRSWRPRPSGSGDRSREPWLVVPQGDHGIGRARRGAPAAPPRAPRRRSAPRSRSRRSAGRWGSPGTAGWTISRDSASAPGETHGEPDRRPAPRRAAPPCPARRRDAAPSAMRMPISWVRWATPYEITPYTPMAASSSAMPPNTVSSMVLNRDWAIDSITPALHRAEVVHRQRGDPPPPPPAEAASCDARPGRPRPAPPRSSCDRSSSTPRRGLDHREVELRHRLLVEPLRADVLHDADDFLPRRVEPSGPASQQAIRLPIGSWPGKRLAGQRLVDHHDQRRAAPVVGGEGPAPAAARSAWSAK